MGSSLGSTEGALAVSFGVFASLMLAIPGDRRPAVVDGVLRSCEDPESRLRARGAAVARVRRGRASGREIERVFQREGVQSPIMTMM